MARPRTATHHSCAHLAGHPGVSRRCRFAARGALPLDSQGNNILMGKKDKNQTTINHVYTDQKPVLTIMRTLDTDTQTLTISEGMIKWVTKDH